MGDWVAVVGPNSRARFHRFAYGYTLAISFVGMVAGGVAHSVWVPIFCAGLALGMFGIATQVRCPWCRQRLYRPFGMIVPRKCRGCLADLGPPL